MSELTTILGSNIRTAIDVNGLLVPANSLAAHLREFTQPAIYANEGYEPFNMSLGGSMAKIKLKDRYFTLLTQHQLTKGHFDYSQVSVLESSTGKMTTTERAIFQTFENQEHTEFDCVICEFSTPVKEGAISASGWYRVDADISEPRAPKPSLVCAVGYPGHRNFIDFETNHYGISPNAVYGREASPSINGRLCFEPVNELDYDPVGLSGSPVFGVSLHSKAPSAFLAGIITEASSKKVHFVSLRNISSFLLRMFDDT